MALTSTPNGIQPIGDQSGTVRTVRAPFGITSGYASNIFKWQPFKLNPATGTFNAIANAGGTPDPIYGIFAGVEFTPLGGSPTSSPFWPAGTVYDPSYQMFVYYWPAWLPGSRFLVQADGSVAATQLGQSFNVTNIAAGSTSLGFSQCTLGAAGVPAGSQGQFTLMEFAPLSGDPDNGGDPYTDLIVTCAYPQIGPKGQNSIG